MQCRDDRLHNSCAAPSYACRHGSGQVIHMPPKRAPSCGLQRCMAMCLQPQSMTCGTFWTSHLSTLLASASTWAQHQECFTTAWITRSRRRRARRTSLSSTGIMALTSCSVLTQPPTEQGSFRTPLLHRSCHMCVQRAALKCGVLLTCWCSQAYACLCLFARRCKAVRSCIALLICTAM